MTQKYVNFTEVGPRDQLTFDRRHGMLALPRDVSQCEDDPTLAPAIIVYIAG